MLRVFSKENSLAILYISFRFGLGRQSNHTSVYVFSDQQERARKISLENLRHAPKAFISVQQKLARVAKSSAEKR